MPDPATAGVLTVFWVGSIPTLTTGVGISASVSSPTVASSETLSSAARGAPSETEDRAPQELRTATTDTTKAMKKIILKKKCSSNELRILGQRITLNEKNNRGAVYSGGPACRRRWPVTEPGSQLSGFAAGRRHLPACGASEEGRVHRDSYHVETRPGLPLRPLSGGTMYPGNDGVLLAGLSNPAHGLDVLLLSNLRGRRYPERQGQIGGPNVDAVHAGRSGDLLHVLEPLPGLDHDEA